MAKFTQEQIDRAAEHGVSKQTLYSRVHYGWDIERAMTTSPESNKSAFNNKVSRSNSWYSHGVNTVLRCPVPNCGHTAGIITKVHCRLNHGMEREEVKKRYGMPFNVTVDAQKRFENTKEGFR